MLIRLFLLAVYRFTHCFKAKNILALLCCFSLFPSTQAAELIADWGEIATPIENETTFSFAQYDLDKNFTHLYSFSLQGDAGATYEVSFNFSNCDYGCGNPDLSYGIYLDHGGLVDASNGSVMLSAGSYAFEVKSTGMGAGNSVDYWGNVTFSLAAGNAVSPAPEPAIYLLLLCIGLFTLLKKHGKRLFLSLLLGLGLSACQPSTPLGQVLAQVGEREITQAQLDFALQQSNLSQPSTAVRKELTDKLINRELLLQQALAQKLDQRPEVLLRLEESRREILAQAYVEQLTQASAKVTENQAAQYYQQHPELFKQRHIYQLQEISLSQQLPQLAQIKQQLQASPQVSSLSPWLTQQKIRFNQQTVIRAAEQLPLATLPRLQQANIGDTVIFESSRGLIVYQLINKTPAPLTWEQAQGIIRDYLIKQAGKRAVDAELKHLRQQYLGAKA